MDYILLYTRIINIFENYFQIKYNKDNKDIKIYKHGDILRIYYNEKEIITLYSLFSYYISKNNKRYCNNYYELSYYNYKNNMIEKINYNSKIIKICNNRKNIIIKTLFYNLYKIYYKNILKYKEYYTLEKYVILSCKYIYSTYNIYIYYNKDIAPKLYNNNYYNYYYNIINIIL